MVAVDLQAMAPLPGVLQIQGDITQVRAWLGVLVCILDKGPPNLGFAASGRKKKTKRRREEKVERRRETKTERYRKAKEDRQSSRKGQIKG